MFISLRGVKALQQLRVDLQESAGIAFPQACLKEMLLLYDVCKHLNLSLFQAREILGAQAYHMVTTYLNAPAGVPTEQAKVLLDSATQSGDAHSDASS